MGSHRRTFMGALLGGVALNALSRTNAFADTAQYAYDALGRLIGVTYSDGSSIAYTYDAAGNRTIVQQTSNQPAPTGSFSANPTTITAGASSSLSWTSANATSASIDNGVGAVTPVAGGSVNVSPTATTVYTLTLIGPGGSTTRQATVTVTPSAFAATIPITGAGPVNLRALANTAGYDGARNATITFTVASGVTITGAAGAINGGNGGIAIDTGDWPSGFTISLALQNAGTIRGGGGGGGKGAGGDSSIPGPIAGGNGGQGGDALYARLALTITNSGTIQAGGGGGGGGGAWQFFDQANLEYSYWNGGGGGGGFPNGGLGQQGVADADVASDGATGTGASGGAGGAGGATGAGARATGAGGAGGNAGVAGAAGAVASGTAGTIYQKVGNGLGAAAGYAVRKNGFTVNVTNTGSIFGPVL
jgi:YD repeat-containing protein